MLYGLSFAIPCQVVLQSASLVRAGGIAAHEVLILRLAERLHSLIIVSLLFAWHHAKCVLGCLEVRLQLQ